MMFLVYRITNRLNGKIYVGAHEGDPTDGYMGSGKLIKRALAKYGPDAFEKVVLSECATAEEMFQKERELVDEAFVGRRDTYNLCPGGMGGCGGKKSHLGFRHSYKPRPKFQETINSRNWWKGKTHSSESREKMRQAKLGSHQSEEHKRRISASLKGQPFKGNQWVKVTQK